MPGKPAGSADFDSQKTSGVVCVDLFLFDVGKPDLFHVGYRCTDVSRAFLRVERRVGGKEDIPSSAIFDESDILMK